ncbi:hypothetical protein FRC00_004129 [Tulasnella sp. 408]|nr:hypothetical protein FRC00_004129 [Tulasnella sp. 408]
MAQQDKEGPPFTSAQLGTAHPASRITPTKSPNSAAGKSPRGPSPKAALQHQARSVATKDCIELSLRNTDSLRMPPGLQDKARPSPPSTLRLPDPSSDQRHFLRPITSSSTLEEREQRTHFLRHSIDFTDPPDAVPFITHRFAPSSPLPHANTTCSLLSVSQNRTDSTYYTTENPFSRSLSARNLEERPASPAFTTADLRTGSRSGSPTVRRVRPSGSLYVDYQSWLAGERKQPNQAASRGPAITQSDSGELLRRELSREGSSGSSPWTLSGSGPQLPHSVSDAELKSAPSSLAFRSPSRKGPVAPRPSRIPSDTTVRGVNTSDRTPFAPSASSIFQRRPSGHASPTIASQLKVKQKVTPPQSSAPITSFGQKSTTPPLTIGQNPYEVTQHARSSLASRNPLVDFVESQKLKKKKFQSPSSSERSPSPTPTKETGNLARRQDLRLAQESESSTTADSDSPLYSPVSPITKQAPSLHQECRQLLQELQRVAEADKTAQDTMKECIAEFARCQARKETLVKRVEDLLDRAEYYKTLALSVHGDGVQLSGENSDYEEVD